MAFQWCTTPLLSGASPEANTMDLEGQASIVLVKTHVCIIRKKLMASQEQVQPMAGGFPGGGSSRETREARRAEEGSSMS